MDIVGNRTLKTLCHEQADTYGDKTFFVYEYDDGTIVSWSYREFNEATDKAANLFWNLGIRHGDKVMLHLGNSPEFLMSWFGLAKIGAAFVPNNPDNLSSETEYVASFSDARLIVTAPGYVDMIKGVASACPNIEQILVIGKQPVPEGTLSFNDLLDAATPDVPAVAIEPEDVVEIIFTSGTTSRPKGVMLTHAVQLLAGLRESMMVRMRSDDVMFTPFPIFHCNCQSISILSSLTSGATMVLPERFHPARFMEQARRHGATLTSLAPAFIRTIMAQPESELDRQNRFRDSFYAINCTDEEKERFEQRFGFHFVNGYGLSEAMTVVTVQPYTTKRRWPSIGLPAIDHQVKVVDDFGNEVPRGQVGELIASGIPGRNLMKGYYKNPQATAEALRDGWLYTGDLVTMDEDGFIYFFDRKKDVIKRGGENVSASEVERVLLEHPGVLEAGVISVPHPIYDETPKAFVVVNDPAVTAEVLEQWCRERLAKFKVPTEWEFRQELPKVLGGNKIEKKALRQQENERRQQPAEQHTAGHTTS